MRVLGPTGRRVVAACAIAATLVLAFGAAFPAAAQEAGGGGGGALLLVAAVLAALIIGEPLFVIIGIIATLCFFLWGEGYDTFESYQVFVVKMANLSTKNVLLAIPFFMISGAIMTAGGIAGKLVDFARALVGVLPGGLAIATVGGCIFFAAISGSSPVTVIAIGTMMYPALVKSGYSERFTLGLITTAGSLGILIPPSIPMLVYAIVASARRTVDVGELFLAGVVPGAFIGILLSIYSMVYAGRHGEGTRIRLSLREIGRKYRDGFWAINLPVLILGGIYSGLFTPTEAAAVSVIYALVVELFIHREITASDVPGIFVESGVLMGSLLVIMALAFGLNDFLVEAKVPDLAVDWIQDMDLSPITFLLIVNVFLIVVGFVMDSISAILIIAPLLVPIADRLGIDPVHLGIVFIVNLEIGYLTPPIGLNLFVSQSVFQKPMGEVMRAVVPFIALMFIGLGVVTYVPTLAMGPVNVLLRDEPFWEPLPTGPEPKAAPATGPPTTAPPSSGKVMSLEEMMKQAGGGSAPDEAPSGKVMSLEEMMRKAKEGDPSEAPEPAPGPPEGKVLSMEEMMRLAREKAPADGTGAAPEDAAESDDKDPVGDAAHGAP